MTVARRALVVGATGLVGRALVGELALDRAYSAIHVIVRRQGIAFGPKVQVHIAQFEALAQFPFPAVDDVYCCLGTTIRDAGSRQAFRTVDYQFVLESAKRARQANARRFALVSALGANPDSPVFYNRVKGEAERDVRALGFESLVIARPSLLLGDRKKLGQRQRFMETLAMGTLSPLAAFLPRRYRPIPAAVVAHALIITMQSATSPVTIMESEALQAISRGPV
ncbi:MAG: nucleoside-diphosphate sugar epimerase [Burkholderiaceae bacterium]|jgi:uncharacterized protein YbjT (DUF2867 family)